MMLSRIKGCCAGELGGRTGNDWGKSLKFNRSERLMRFTELVLVLLSLERARVREHPPAGHVGRHRFRQP